MPALSTELVRLFHERFGFPVDAPLGRPETEPAVYGGKRAENVEATLSTMSRTLKSVAVHLREHAEDLRAARASLVLEEAGELLEALYHGSRVDVADDLADLAYVTYGTAVSYGIDLDGAIAEVHRSNMTKTPGDFKPVKDAGYQPPELAQFLLPPRREG